ncbi:MAG: hypothetical protein U1E40_01705 [Amaricoccus sp.]
MAMVFDRDADARGRLEAAAPDMGEVAEAAGREGAGAEVIIVVCTPGATGGMRAQVVTIARLRRLFARIFSEVWPGSRRRRAHDDDDPGTATCIRGSRVFLAALEARLAAQVPARVMPDEIERRADERGGGAAGLRSMLLSGPRRA